MRWPQHRRDAALLSIAVGVVGVTFGVLAESAELSLAKAVALSALVFTGASQFAAVSLLKDGSNPMAALGSALLLAARNALYGPLVAPLLGRSPARRAAGAQFVIDETTGMATAQSDTDRSRDAFWFTAVLLFVLWVAGTVVGVAVGNALGDPERFGLDAAFPAAFVALLAPHVRTRAGRVAAALGAGLALGAIPLSPAGVPVLVASLGALAALRVRGAPSK